MFTLSTHGRIISNGTEEFDELVGRLNKFIDYVYRYQNISSSRNGKIYKMFATIFAFRLYYKVGENISYSLKPT